jgi:hypothetical protein
MWTEATRRKYDREGQRDASDLNAEWALIEPHMPAKHLGRRACDRLRSVLDFVFRADRLSVANAAKGVPALHHGARLFLRLAQQRLV